MKAIPSASSSLQSDITVRIPSIVNSVPQKITFTYPHFGFPVSVVLNSIETLSNATMDAFNHPYYHFLLAAACYLGTWSGVLKAARKADGDLAAKLASAAAAAAAVAAPAAAPAAAVDTVDLIVNRTYWLHRFSNYIKTLVDIWSAHWATDIFKYYVLVTCFSSIGKNIVETILPGSEAQLSEQTALAQQEMEDCGFEDNAPLLSREVNPGNPVDMPILTLEQGIEYIMNTGGPLPHGTHYVLPSVYAYETSAKSYGVVSDPDAPEEKPEILKGPAYKKGISQILAVVQIGAQAKYIAIAKASQRHRESSAASPAASPAASSAAAAPPPPGDALCRAMITGDGFYTYAFQQGRATLPPVNARIAFCMAVRIGVTAVVQGKGDGDSVRNQIAAEKKCGLITTDILGGEDAVKEGAPYSLMWVSGSGEKGKLLKFRFNPLYTEIQKTIVERASSAGAGGASSAGAAGRRGGPRPLGLTEDAIGGIVSTAVAAVSSSKPMQSRDEVLARAGIRRGRSPTPRAAGGGGGRRRGYRLYNGNSRKRTRASARRTSRNQRGGANVSDEATFYTEFHTLLVDYIKLILLCQLYIRRYAKATRVLPDIPTGGAGGAENEEEEVGGLNTEAIGKRELDGISDLNALMSSLTLSAEDEDATSSDFPFMRIDDVLIKRFEMILGHHGQRSAEALERHLNALLRMEGAPAAAVAAAALGAASSPAAAATASSALTSPPRSLPRAGGAGAPDSAMGSLGAGAGAGVSSTPLALSYQASIEPHELTFLSPPPTPSAYEASKQQAAALRGRSDPRPGPPSASSAGSNYSKTNPEKLRAESHLAIATCLDAMSSIPPELSDVSSMVTSKLLQLRGHLQTRRSTALTGGASVMSFSGEGPERVERMNFAIVQCVEASLKFFPQDPASLIRQAVLTTVLPLINDGSCMDALRGFIDKLYDAFESLVDMTEAAEGGDGSGDIETWWEEVQEPLGLLFEQEKVRCDAVFRGASLIFAAASAGGAAALAASAAAGGAAASAGGAAAAAAEPENRKNTGTGRRNSRRRRRATSTLRRTRKNTH